MRLLADFHNSRREFLRLGGAVLGAAALVETAGLLGCGPKDDKAPVLAPEKLLQDHGVLQRLLLVFEEMAGRLKYDRGLPPGVLPGALEMARTFVQDHHERMEEDLLFPRLEPGETHGSLIKVLKQQHQAGREVLGLLKAQATPEGMGRLAGRVQAGVYLRLFARMYRPHAAREDVVLIPALRAATAPPEFAALGRKWQEQEEARLGQGGYEKLLATVDGLEKELGLADLSQYTLKV